MAFRLAGAEPIHGKTRLGSYRKIRIARFYANNRAAYAGQA